MGRGEDNSGRGRWWRVFSGKGSASVFFSKKCDEIYRVRGVFRRE
jgi:hypothetical protein